MWKATHLDRYTCEANLYDVKPLRFEGLSVIAAGVPTKFWKPMSSAIPIIISK